MLPAEVSQGPVLLISPHLDDAAFSAGALLELPGTEVWTVFAGIPSDPGPTEWDRRCGFDDSRSLMNARREEDARALEGIRFRQLDYLERAYVGSGRDDDLTAIREAVTAWLRANPSGTLALPAGAGVEVASAWHERLRNKGRASRSQPADAPPAASGGREPEARSGPKDTVKGLIRRLLHADYLRRRRSAQRKGMLANDDHTQLRDSLLPVAQAENADVVLYEELPYLWSKRGDGAAQMAATTIGRVATRVEPTIDTDRKFVRMKQYATQLSVMDPVHRRLEDPAQLPASERYWVIPASHSAEPKGKQ